MKLWHARPGSKPVLLQLSHVGYTCEVLDKLLSQSDYISH